MQSERKLFQLALVLMVGFFMLLWLLWGALRSLSVRTLAAKAARKAVALPASGDPRLRGAYRFDQAGWIYVHLAGAPDRVGFQHGYLLAPEIADAFEAVKLSE